MDDTDTSLAKFNFNMIDIYICQIYLSDVLIPKRTAYVILGMLSIEPNKSGYDIRKAIEGSVGSFWGESYGQIYPTLQRLAAEGLIRPSPSVSKAKRRQEYMLTAKGRSCLREWLAQPFHNDPPRNEFLLKLFFGGEADPEVSIRHVEEVQRKNRQMLNTLLGIEKIANKSPSQSPSRPYWMLTLKLGIALTQTALDWGETTLVELASMKALSGKDSKSAKGLPILNQPIQGTPKSLGPAKIPRRKNTQKGGH